MIGFVLDIVREILENRAELYRALYQGQEESEEEGEPTQDDINLAEHMKLKEELAHKQSAEGELFVGPVIFSYLFTLCFW